MFYIGIMSGTSLDGIDTVLVEIQPSSFNVIASYYEPYNAQLKNHLQALSHAPTVGFEPLIELENSLTTAYATTCQQLLQQHDIDAQDVVAIGCHGQTIRHQPRPNAFSWQLANGHLLTELTGITCVTDFRRRDIAAGGEGAPLVPAFHQDVFAQNHNPRQILNLGGIANVSVLFQDADDSLGFDLGPANALSDEWTQQHWQQPYDRGGVIASSGKVQDDLLSQWLALPFFQQAPPKSTGRELFNLATLIQLTPELTEREPKDVLATLVEFSARTIADGIQQWGHQDGELFLCGGGTHNIHLVERIQKHLPDLRIGLTDDLGIPADLVEAAAFAWLAYRTLNRESGNLPKATGASGNRILGSVHFN